jgi:hypothetical protein
MLHSYRCGNPRSNILGLRSPGVCLSEKHGFQQTNPSFTRTKGIPMNNLSVYLRNSPALVKSKAIPVTGHGGPQGCETSRLPHFLENRLTDGGEVSNLTRQPAALYPEEDSLYSFLLEAESIPGP